ncbi:alkaline-phosphatase-like protein [Thelonectria olida]|uniref:Alkaline-phosphatase-like protein n=1 Tax=Thelonectria olida TaxID=1576542 RepID=A0A9P8VN12_9HYPO|nr:alkaline-phosphatase-like protein [Thelonectria olida]
MAPDLNSLSPPSAEVPSDSEPSKPNTPNLDRLAAELIQFDSACYPSPLCAPSRMSMVTGLLPTKIGAYVPTYARYLRTKGYHTALAGKMHFVGDQLHGYKQRLTSDIYPADFGWAVNWDDPDARLEWYHNASSILQAGPCGRSNQLDYDEEVMFDQSQSKQTFCLTVSLTHPHNPYTITKKYWDLYEDTDVSLPEVRITKQEQDSHSKRLLQICDLWDQSFPDEQTKRAKRAYYGSVSYVDDCIGRLLETLEGAGLADSTIFIFSGDHGDMLGERDLWYKMSYFESSVRVPMLVHYLQRFHPHLVRQNVSTLDILPTICDLVGTKPASYLPMDGTSLLPHLEGWERSAAQNTIFAEYMGEGTAILERDPKELNNLARSRDIGSDNNTAEGQEARRVFEEFEAEANAKWDFEGITTKAFASQRARRLVWEALREGEFSSWDFDPIDDGRKRYIRSTIPLDKLERRARFPFVSTHGYQSKAVSLTRE